jgi:hypothetical protein
VTCDSNVQLEVVDGGCGGVCACVCVRCRVCGVGWRFTPLSTIHPPVLTWSIDRSSFVLFSGSAARLLHPITSSLHLLILHPQLSPPRHATFDEHIALHCTTITSTLPVSPLVLCHSTHPNCHPPSLLISCLSCLSPSVPSSVPPFLPPLFLPLDGEAHQPASS